MEQPQLTLGSWRDLGGYAMTSALTQTDRWLAVCPLLCQTSRLGNEMAWPFRRCNKCVTQGLGTRLSPLFLRSLHVCTAWFEVDSSLI
jgi:hypothetical protein